jgi:hypothetical protein
MSEYPEDILAERHERAIKAAINASVAEYHVEGSTDESRMNAAIRAYLDAMGTAGTVTQEPGAVKVLREIEREASSATSSTYAVAVSVCQRIRDIARSALSSPPSEPAPQVVEDWQPIETAPADTVGYFAWPCLIGFTAWGSNHHIGPIVFQPTGQWEFTELDFDMFSAPTHWMPLPTATALASQEKKG